MGTGLVGGRNTGRGGLEMLHRAMRELCTLAEEVKVEYKPSCMGMETINHKENSGVGNTCLPGSGTNAAREIESLRIGMPLREGRERVEDHKQHDEKTKERAEISN